MYAAPPVMPKCCCCSVKIGLLIWIVINILAAVVSLFIGSPQGTAGMLSMIATGLGVIVNVFGGYAVFAQKRLLVKVYAFGALLTTLISAAISIYYVYSDDLIIAAEEAFAKLIDDNPNLVLDMDKFISTMQMTMWVSLIIGLILQGVVLVFVFFYHKYLAQVETVKLASGQNKPHA